MVKIDISIGPAPIPPQGSAPKAKIHLNAPTILRFLIGDDELVNDLIILGIKEKDLMTTDKDLYEALGSITKYDSFRPTKLAKFFEMVDVYPFRDMARQQKPVLTFEKVEGIRKEALRKNEEAQKNNQKKEGEKNSKKQR